ncbi:hypothetical protein C3743_39425 [Burkholderia contaminans]|uniref:Uncharacterized protein n=1 Tax=Burkholderia contaminans TaxID=488447 RepID=A0A2S5DN18_9BURK|nr:hypothetical protein C3743_39425 [Burkholderia contaminans]
MRTGALIMDYVLANFMAIMAAAIFSVFTSFIASRSGRLIYRKIMWGYLTTLLVAAIVITVMQLPFTILAFGALFFLHLRRVRPIGRCSQAGPSHHDRRAL